MNLLTSHNLWNITDQPIEISGAVDGNTLTKSVNCVTACMKLVDFALVCPMTGKAINVSSNDVNNSILTQSRDQCFPLKILIGQESKATMENFRDMHEFLSDLSSANTEGKCKVFPHMLPFRVSRCGDHVTHQKTSEKGGHVK